MTLGSYAKVIADSISPEGVRLTTIEVRFHRFVLAEWNTHRVFSRNSASSRAIPFSKQVERVFSCPAVPVSFPAEQKGMSGGEELTGIDRKQAEADWLDAREDAVKWAQRLARRGIHKSVVNRLLEPFMWHTVVCTSTAWENFLRQRVSPLAQPEIRVAAEMVQNVFNRSNPTPISEGEWHLPYVQEEDWEVAKSRYDDPQCELVKVSAGRCARVSYLTQDGKRDLDEDVRLYDRLVSADPMHASPLEHPATPAAWNSQEVILWRNPKSGKVVRVEREAPSTFTLALPVVGNFMGWQQHRIAVEIENQWQSFS